MTVNLPRSWEADVIVYHRLSWRTRLRLLLTGVVVVRLT